MKKELLIIPIMLIAALMLCGSVSAATYNTGSKTVYYSVWDKDIFAWSTTVNGAYATNYVTKKSYYDAGYQYPNWKLTGTVTVKGSYHKVGDIMYCSLNTNDNGYNMWWLSKTWKVYTKSSVTAFATASLPAVKSYTFNY